MTFFNAKMRFCRFTKFFSWCILSTVIPTTWIAFPFYPQTKRAAQTCGSLCHAVQKRPPALWHQGILRQTARYCGLSFQNFGPSDFGMSMLCNKSRKKTPENRSFPGKMITFLSLAELRCTTGGLQTVLGWKNPNFSWYSNTFEDVATGLSPYINRKYR